jgi:Ca-activated chloride channel family protein
MKFLWPQMLWLATALPMIVAAYVLILRHNRKRAVRYASIGIARQAMRGGPTMRRHVPPLLLFLAVAAMLLGAARPAAVVTLPSHHETVILAIDVSGSMRAQDVEPTRLAAAQAAAKSFIAEQPPGTRIGIVEYSATAALVQAPTASREELERTVDRLRTQGATAIGSAILVSLKALFPDAQVDLLAPNLYRRRAGMAAPPAKPAPSLRATAPGSYKSAAVILLTDGQNSAGPDPVEAARMAAERGLRIYTVGFGTENGEMSWDGGAAMRVALDEPTLQTIAGLTGAQYFHAGTASELKAVYRNLNAGSILETKSTEITAIFAAAAIMVLLAAWLLSLLWFHRPA